MTGSKHKRQRSDLELILHALEFAAHKHRDQRRKDVHASPYINHPIALANILVNEADIHDPEVICAALLHDTIEDTETTAAELESEFGAVVRDIVLEVTDDKLLPKTERKRLQIEKTPGKSTRARLLKIADKTSNLRGIVHSPPQGWSAERLKEYVAWAEEVVRSCRGLNAALEAKFDEAYREARRHYGA